MNKVQEKGDSYIQSESERLGRMVGKYMGCPACLFILLPSSQDGKKVNAKKSDEFAKRRNVLRKFEL